MSQRERWIVYPLLFFSFALAIRDQVPEWRPAPDFNIVTCHQLMVKDPGGGVAVDIHAQPSGPNAGSGVVVVKSGSPEVGTAKLNAVRIGVAHRRDTAEDAYGTVETFGPLGSPAVQLTSDDGGGAIQRYDRAGKLIVNGEDGNDPRNDPVQPPKPDSETQTSPGEANGGKDVSTDEAKPIGLHEWERLGIIQATRFSHFLHPASCAVRCG